MGCQWRKGEMGGHGAREREGIIERVRERGGEREREEEKKKEGRDSTGRRGCRYPVDYLCAFVASGVGEAICNWEERE